MACSQVQATRIGGLLVAGLLLEKKFVGLKKPSHGIDSVTSCSKRSLEHIHLCSLILRGQYS